MLSEIYHRALASDAQMQAAEATYRAQEQNRPLALAPLLPQVSFNLGYAEGRQRLTGQRFGMPTSAVERGTTQQDSLSIRQVLYRHDLYVALRRAESEVARARAVRDAAHQDLILRAARAYFDVLQARDDKRLAVQERSAIRRQWEQAQARFEVGLGSVVETQETRAAYDLASVREIDANNVLLDRMEALSVITGSRHHRFGSLAQDLPLPHPDPADIEQWVEKALEQNLEYLVRTYDLEVARRNLEHARAQHYPTLDARISSGKTRTTAGVFGANRLQEEQFGLELRVPIFEGGATTARSQAAAHQLEAARAQLAHARRTTEQKARSAYHDVHAGIARVEAYVQALKSARVELEANQVGLETGTRDTVDVVLATSKVYNAERDLARARYDHVLEVLGLAQVAGSLSEADLRRVDRWLH